MEKEGDFFRKKKTVVADTKAIEQKADPVELRKTFEQAPGSLSGRRRWDTFVKQVGFSFPPD